jgi:hypothetical protein
MVEQNIREAMRVADRIYVLVGGRNRFEGVPADIKSGRQLMELYLGAPAAENPPPYLTSPPPGAERNLGRDGST